MSLSRIVLVAVTLKQAVAVTTRSKCSDEHENCPTWAEVGYCNRQNTHSDYMILNCKESCNLCQSVQDCKDSNADCGYWSKLGECSKNPGFMNQYCKLSCNVCNSKYLPV